MCYIIRFWAVTSFFGFPTQPHHDPYKYQHKAGRAALGLSCGACFELPDPVYFGSGAYYSISKARKWLILCFRPVWTPPVGCWTYKSSPACLDTPDSRYALPGLDNWTCHSEYPLLVIPSLTRNLLTIKEWGWNSVGLRRHEIYLAVSREALRQINLGEFQVHATQGLVIPGRSGQRTRTHGCRCTCWHRCCRRRGSGRGYC